MKKALQIAGEMGVVGVEIDARQQVKPRELTQTGLRQLRKMLDDRNLQVAAVGFRTRRGYGVVDDLDRRIEATKEAMKLAYQLGAKVLVNDVGGIPGEATDPGWDLLCQVLSELGQYGQRQGVFLAADTGSTDPQRLVDLIAALPPGSLAVNLNPGNLIVNGFSASEATRLLGQHVQHVHARDAVRDLARGRGTETPLGRGSVDFAELIGTLEEYEYRGYFTIEREHAADPVAECAQAVRYLRQL